MADVDGYVFSGFPICGSKLPGEKADGFVHAVVMECVRQANLSHQGFVMFADNVRLSMLTWEVASIT